MLAAFLAFLEAMIDDSPAILTALGALLAKKQQQYATVLASVDSETADAVAELDQHKA